MTLGDDGSIVGIVNSHWVKVWASQRHRIGQLFYETIDISDLAKWQAAYLIPGSGGLNEYGKPKSFMNATPTPFHALVTPTISDVYFSNARGEIIVRSSFSREFNLDFGAPAEVWTVYRFPDKATIETDVYMVNKTSTRLPEAIFYSFNPVAESGEIKWEQNILGEWSEPNDVAEGAAKGMHYVTDEGVRVTDDSMNSIQARSLDAGLIRWGNQCPSNPH